MLESNNSIFSAQNITLVHSGEDYFARLEQMILESELEIHIQTYIFEYDATGKKIIAALEIAAAKNVKINILIDGFGSLNFPTEVIHNLSKIGINFRIFSPLFSANSLYIGRRLHHKVIVSDAKKVLIGGINIADKYHGTPKEKPWLDYAVEITDETIAKSLQELCRDMYFKNRIIRRKKIKSFIENSQENCVTILQNDWLKRKNEVFKSYINKISTAEKEIVIVNSYFLPGKKLIKTLKISAQNNVTIKLILSGISDVPMARRASCHLYSKLLRYNIELYEWKKTILHGKTAIIDGNWTTIGSFNLNNLSSFASIEMNVAIESDRFAKEYLVHLSEIINQCERITAETIDTKHNWTSKFTNWASYWLSRIIEIIITFIPHKRFRKFY
ncbi:MAG TPA: phospholipase D-like domain-containing protein [Flavobacterium alvei]|nr:phospholipase D-like domain-containing protein [Flavobacterium alvei]